MSAPARIPGRLARTATPLARVRSQVQSPRAITTCFPRRTILRQSYAATSRTTQARLFSISASRPMATPDDSFDPATIERESDQVDVCIVGGGATPISTNLTCSAVLSKSSSISNQSLLRQQAQQVSPQPSASNNLPTKPEMRTSAYCYSRRPAKSEPTSSPVPSSSPMPSRSSSPTGWPRTTSRASTAPPLLATTTCAS